MYKKICLIIAFTLLVGFIQYPQRIKANQPIPVILDTDISDDIDDTWALAQIIKDPRYSVKLIVSSRGNTQCKAKIVAKFLEESKRSDINVGVGVPTDPINNCGRQKSWVNNYDISSYQGNLYNNGAQAIVDTINENPGNIYLIVIGPATNIKKALEIDPTIQDKVSLYSAMAGSIYKGWRGEPGAVSEYNVGRDPEAAKAVLSARWPIILAPLDTAAEITINQQNYTQIFNAKNTDPILNALIQNYTVWYQDRHNTNPPMKSTTLFDTLAVYLPVTNKNVNLELLKIKVEGTKTVISEDGKQMQVATSWSTSKQEYENELTKILLSEFDTTPTPNPTPSTTLDQRYDLDENGVINILDLVEIIKFLFS